MKLIIYAEPDDWQLAVRAAKEPLGPRGDLIVAYDNGKSFYVLQRKNTDTISVRCNGTLKIPADA